MVGLCLTDTSLQTSAAVGKNKHDELESMANPAKPNKLIMFEVVFVSERRRVCIGIIPA